MMLFIFAFVNKSDFMILYCKILLKIYKAFFESNMKKYTLIFNIYDVTDVLIFLKLCFYNILYQNISKKK